MVAARMPVICPLAAMAAFVLLLVLTVAGWAPLDAFDAAVSGWFRRYGATRPDVVGAVRVVTDVAATWTFLLGGAVATVALRIRGLWRAALLAAVVTASVPVMWSVLHLVVFSPRPANGFVVVPSNSFPSGHTSNATAAALLAALLLWPRLGRVGRMWLALVAAAFPLFVGLTRVLLLAHWPADVVGGWLLALAVVPPLARLVGPVGRRDREPAEPPAGLP
jgi:membrane-associated phospholipid phosphatase